MDTPDKIQVETETVLTDRQTDHRRGSPKGYWDGDFYVISKVSRYYEEIGDDLGRHKRMAEAMYEC
jgi:hypothetical protein